MSLKSIRLNTLFKTNYVLITKNNNKQYCIKNGSDWMILDTDKNEVIVDKDDNVLFFTTKTIAESCSTIYKNRLSLSNFKGVHNSLIVNEV